MKSNRLMICFFGAALAAIMHPLVGSAQTDTTGTTTTTTTSTNTGGVTGGATGVNTGGLNNGSGFGGSGTNQNSSTNQNQATAAIPVQSITTGAGSATSTPSNSNPFVQTYVDPLSVGLASKFTQFGVATKPTGTFAKGLYVNATSTTTGGRGAAGGAAGGAANQQTSSFTTIGTPRAPSYATVMDPDLLVPVPTAAKMQSDLRASLERSSFLTNQRNIEIVVNGPVVELRGFVSTEKERRAAEGIVSLTPGVIDVINQLQVASPTAAR